MRHTSSRNALDSRLSDIAALAPRLLAAADGGAAAPPKTAGGILSLAASPALAAVGLFCLLGLAVSAVAILHGPDELFGWVLAHIE